MYEMRVTAFVVVGVIIF
jgi:hypothetical protein